MAVEAPNVVVRPLSDTDIEDITRIDEKVGGVYRPDFWEHRVIYYLRRDPEGSQVARVGGKVVGFMLGDFRAGEFGLEEPSGWIERFGIDPDYRGQGIGRQLFDAMAAPLEEHGCAQPAHARGRIAGGQRRLPGGPRLRAQPRSTATGDARS